MLAPEPERFGGSSAWSLAEGHQRTGERDCADETAGEEFGEQHRVVRLREGGADGDQHRGESHEAVRNAATSCGMAVILIRSAMSVPITASPTIPAMIQPYDLTAGVEQGGGYGHRHAGHGVDVATHAEDGWVRPFRPRIKKGRGAEVGEASASWGRAPAIKPDN